MHNTYFSIILKNFSYEILEKSILCIKWIDFLEFVAAKFILNLTFFFHLSIPFLVYIIGGTFNLPSIWSKIKEMFTRKCNKLSAKIRSQYKKQIINEHPLQWPFLCCDIKQKSVLHISLLAHWYNLLLVERSWIWQLSIRKKFSYENLPLTFGRKKS